MNEIEQKIKSLVSELNVHNYKYYVLNDPDISDYEFDVKLKRLQLLESEYPQYRQADSPILRVGGTITKNFRHIRHAFPMLSLENTYNEGDLRAFDNRVRSVLGVNKVDYFCELKFDGISISLLYENGFLKHAVTRGDGIQGDDITENVRTVKSVPLKITGNDIPKFLEVRGEILMPHEAFRRLNEEKADAGNTLFANPRNATGGSLKLHDSSEVARRNLDAFIYYLNTDMSDVHTHSEGIERLKKWKFKVSENTALCYGIEEVFDFIRFWDLNRRKLPFDIDGIVLKVNNLSYQKQLGNTAKSPRWAIAYKFKAERVATILLSVSYQLGRIGTVTPVANLKEVSLGGTIVKRATLHNADVMQHLDLHERDTVYVEKGGEIIPKIVGVDISMRKSDAKPIIFIKNCPACGTPLIREENEAAHYCPNHLNCIPQIKARIEHFISRKAMNIEGLGEGRVDMLVENGLIKKAADLYDLNYDRLLGLEKSYINNEKERVVSFREKTVENILAAIEKSKKVPFERVLFALGIRYVGEASAKRLARHFKTMSAIEQADREDLLQVDDVGEVMADSITNYFKDPENLQTLYLLSQKGLNFELRGVAHSGKFAGLNFIFSGSFGTSQRRKELESMVEENGGKLLSSVSSKLNYIVAGENMGPSKSEKAKKMGIPVINEADFLKMLQTSSK